jgi:undecaprenyl-diphosphatase
MTRLSVSFYAACAALAAAFVALLLLGGPESRTDRAVLAFAQVDFLTPAARLVTRLGDWWLHILAGASGALWLALRRRRREAFLMVAIFAGERFLVGLLKLWFDRARPDAAGHEVAVHSMAFPSGHAANAMTLGLAFALLLPRTPEGRRAALPFALAFAFLVGATRPVLGVHWPSDVLGGWILGLLWVLLLLRLTAGTAPRRRH